MKRNVKILVTLFLLIMTSVSFASASSFDDGLKATAKKTGHTEVPLANTDIGTIVGTTIGILLGLLGVYFLGLMIYGGYIWMMARGNEQDITKAQNIIQNAIIGLIIVLAAYAITAFIGKMVPTSQEDCVQEAARLGQDPNTTCGP